MTKAKRLPKDAKPVTVSLTPEEELALQVIESRRRKRGDKRDSRNEIISDALWRFLTDVEKVPRDRINDLLSSPSDDQIDSNLKTFPKKGSKLTS